MQNTERTQECLRYLLRKRKLTHYLLPLILVKPPLPLTLSPISIN